MFFKDLLVYNVLFFGYSYKLFIGVINGVYMVWSGSENLKFFLG